MNSNVAVAQATSREAVLPVRVQEALGQLVGAAKEGLLALSVGVGLGVLTELMEEEVEVNATANRYQAAMASLAAHHPGAHASASPPARPRPARRHQTSEPAIAAATHTVEEPTYRPLETTGTLIAGGHACL